jgi:hypothetical protein
MKLQPDVQNIVENDGLAVSLTGMAIVFMGLLLVSVFIACLPRLLVIYDRFRMKGGELVDGGRSEVDDKRDEEIAVAIAMVLERAMTPEDGSAFQRITIRRVATDMIWKQGGLLRSHARRLPARKNRQ